MNNIVIAGNVGNVEFKEINGTSLLTFSLAVKKSYSKDQANDTDWFRCNLWGKRADSLQQYILKGVGLVVSGEMNLNYDKEKKIGYPSVNVNQLDITKWAEKADREPDQAPKQAPPETLDDGFKGFQAIDSEDSIPF